MYKLGGSAAALSKSSSKLVVASFVLDYVRTFIEALEYQRQQAKQLDGKKETTTAKTPQLLTAQKQCNVGGEKITVYGPVNVSATLPNNTFEVWVSHSDTKDEEDKDNLHTTTTAPASDNDKKIAVVLGAGNQSMLTIIDILDNTLRHRRPVLVKHHPLRPWLIHPYAIMLAPLIKRGYFSQCLDVGIEVTKTLLCHPLVNHVHITGSFSTAKSVMDVLQKAHPNLSNTQVSSMVTSELGCATPQIMDDGVYTEAELTHAARMIACGKKTNGGSNCLSPQVVVLSKHWEQKGYFRKVLLEELKRQPTTPCYYPGSLERKKIQMENCRQFGSKCIEINDTTSVSEETVISSEDQVVVVECGTPGEEGYNSQPLLLEAFGPLLAIVELDGQKDDDNFLVNAIVPFLNNKENIYGSLSCSVFTPKSKGTHEERDTLQNFLATLNYGTIAVNQMNLFGYTCSTKGGIWGGHVLEKLGQSGNGNIGDLFGIVAKNTAKCVVYGPPLETKPMLDNANPPPPIVFDVLVEFICSDSILKGMARASILVFGRMLYGAFSYMPVIGSRFVQQ